MSPFLVYRMGDIAGLPEAEVRPVGRALVIPGQQQCRRQCRFCVSSMHTPVPCYGVPLRVPYRALC